jgi:TldD protein
LVGGGAAALASACAGARDSLVVGRAPGAGGGGRYDEVLERALAAAKRAGASYADARVVRRREEGLGTREDHVVHVAYEETFGVGVRVIVNGAWGFAATARVEPAAVEETARRACAMATAFAGVSRRPVELAPAPAVTASWTGPCDRDPFEVPLEEKTAMLLTLWAEARATGGVQRGQASLDSTDEWKIFASSEGSRIEQRITRVDPGFTVTAVDPVSGEFESVSVAMAPAQAGYEYVERSALRMDARQAAENAARKLKAPPVTPGKRDLVIAPSNLWLVIHESIGHATELDRAMGFEANFAGTSYATPEKRGKLRIGSPIVNVYADRTTPGGLATCAYDDDGVKAQRWDLVKDGVFVGYQTTREQAGWIGERVSRGACDAYDFRSFPFQRMPNVSLAPAQKEVTLEDLVAATDDGVYAVGNASWSIDHQRYNFQFGAQMAYQIKKGKIAGVVRRFAYQSNSITFWNSCDMLGGPASWRLGGALNDGKGQPGQSHGMSHGCPPTRFRGIDVLDVGAGRAKGAA